MAVKNGVHMCICIAVTGYLLINICQCRCVAGFLYKLGVCEAHCSFFSACIKTYSMSNTLQWWCSHKYEVGKLECCWL